MIPTRVLRRGVIRLIFIIPVLWFALFLTSFYIDDILNPYIDDTLNNDKRHMVTNKKNINVHNFIKDISKMDLIPVNAHTMPINKAPAMQSKANQKTIGDQKQTRTTKRHLKSSRNRTRHNDNDVTVIDETRNKDRQVLAAPNHPKMRLIDPNGPGDFCLFYAPLC